MIQQNQIKWYFFLGFFLILLISCKKVPTYGISDGMKEYFSFKPGSYWIYKNDSTGAIDSTYVKSYQDEFIEYKDYDKVIMNSEHLAVGFQSVFLGSFYIEHLDCWGSNILEVGSRQKPSDTGLVDGDIAYYPSVQQNQHFITDCDPSDVYIFKVIPADTINGKVYLNVLYSEIQRIDSSTSNQHYYYRKIHFVKHIGIIKYFEISRFRKIQRSFSLMRNKSIQ